MAFSSARLVGSPPAKMRCRSIGFVAGFSAGGFPGSADPAHVVSPQKTNSSASGAQHDAQSRCRRDRRRPAEGGSGILDKKRQLPITTALALNTLQPLPARHSRQLLYCKTLAPRKWPRRQFPAGPERPPALGREVTRPSGLLDFGEKPPCIRNRPATARHLPIFRKLRAPCRPPGLGRLQRHRQGFPTSALSNLDLGVARSERHSTSRRFQNPPAASAVSLTTRECPRYAPPRSDPDHLFCRVLVRYPVPNGSSRCGPDSQYRKRVSLTPSGGLYG